MKRTIPCSLLLVSFLCFAAACGDDHRAVDGAPINLFDAAVPDAVPIPDAMPPPDAQLFDLQAAVGIDEMSIVGGDAFLGLGSIALGAINDQINGQIDSGALLLALEWRSLDDPSGQVDDALDIGFYQCEDPDMDAGNNFNATDPDRWVASATSIDTDGQPTVVFPNGSIVGGVLDATSDGTIVLPGLPLPIAITNPHLTGVMTAAPDALSVHFFEKGTDGKGEVAAMISGAITADNLGAAPNITMGACAGGNLLDIFAIGCSIPGFIDIPPSQPDTDLDNDGLEQLCDECSDPACLPTGSDPVPDAGMPDGVIDCCLDGDGITVIESTNCWMDPKIADGYTIDLAIHGTRIILMSGVDPI